MVVEGGKVAVVVEHGLAQDWDVLFGHKVEHGIVANGGVLRLTCKRIRDDKGSDMGATSDMIIRGTTYVQRLQN